MNPYRILMPSVAAPNDASGAGTVTRNLIRMLEAPPLQASVECLTRGVPRRRSLHRLRQAAAVARALAGQMPARAAFTYSGRLRDEVATRAADCDLMLLNGSEMLWALDSLPAGVPRVVVAHNIEHEVFVAEAEATARRFPALSPLLRREIERLREWEIGRLRQVGRAVFLSSDDAARAQACGWVRESLVVPPVFFDPPAPRRVPAGARVEVGFLGNLHWWPNREGLRWFLDEVLPRVRDTIRLHIFGPGSEELGRRDDVVGYGRIADLAQVWSSCDLMISPLRHGGGVSVKVAEALYQGMPLLATSCSLRGLTLPADDCVAILDQAAEWVAFLQRRVDAWRGQRVSPDISALFSATGYAPRLQDFVSGRAMGYA